MRSENDNEFLIQSQTRLKVNYVYKNEKCFLNLYVQLYKHKY